ncbi:Cell wall integrity protein scw1 [Fusarium oxysporum f. sp. albedinis]|jgi:hypothetical protein|nr:Cell wall integrity protein scw1 [Fusarium oxysporum f. sp. albedinis]
MLPAGDLYSKQNSRRDATMSIGLFGDQKFANTLGRKGRKKAKTKTQKNKKKRDGERFSYDGISRCGIMTSRHGCH